VFETIVVPRSQLLANLWPANYSADMGINLSATAGKALPVIGLLLQGDHETCEQRSVMESTYRNKRYELSTQLPISDFPH
jgi:hypothetical protein